MLHITATHTRQTDGKVEAILTTDTGGFMKISLPLGIAASFGKILQKEAGQAPLFSPKQNELFNKLPDVYGEANREILRELIKEMGKSNG